MEKKTQEILRHLGTQKGANLCLKCTKIRLTASDLLAAIEGPTSKGRKISTD